MPITVRRLGAGDEAVLALLAREEADFDLDGRSGPAEPLDAARARAFLENPATLQWVAIDDETVVGFLLCIDVPLRAGAGRELLLYEIGVRGAWRRRGVGRALLEEMERWMRTNGVDEVWVLADNPEAVEFYRACRLAPEAAQPVYMTRALSSEARPPADR